MTQEDHPAPTSLEVVALELRALSAETRGGFAQLHARQADFRVTVVERLDALTGELAVLRQEVYNHTHPRSS